MNPDYQTKTPLSDPRSHTPVCTRPYRKIEKTDERTNKRDPSNIKIMTNELKESKITQYFQHLPRACPQLKNFESKTLIFENRSAAYFWVREHRKRRKAMFAGQKTIIETSSKAYLHHAANLG